jgi:hypothetical protein
MKLLEENQCIVLVGETGSGKTTQIPQWYVFIFILEWFSISLLLDLGHNLLFIFCGLECNYLKLVFSFLA